MTTANRTLKKTSWSLGHHTRAHRIRRVMKHWGTSAKVISRVSPTRIAESRNSAIIAQR
ncbi:hypothetical protein M2164_007030 [Streptomyces sp. SAI-208]|nr:hypothetical protein [Streptomyces sp. SAI-208]